MSWASLLPTAVRHEKKYLDNASRYAFPNTKMQLSKVSPIKTFSFEPSPNHSSAGSILSTKQHQTCSYSPQGCGKLPNKGNNTAHGKTMPSRCQDIISDEKPYGAQRSFPHSLSSFNPPDGTSKHNTMEGVCPSLCTQCKFALLNPEKETPFQAQRHSRGKTSLILNYCITLQVKMAEIFGTSNQFKVGSVTQGSITLSNFLFIVTFTFLCLFPVLLFLLYLFTFL